MPIPQRLPVINGDDGQWGSILNQYINKEHYNDATDNPVNGGHQTITIRAGTATAGTAPLKFTSGTLLTSAEAGAMEFNSDTLYFTVTTGTVRRTVATYDDASGATGDVYYRNSSGVITRLGIGSTGNVLKVSGGLPSWGTISPAFATTTKTASYTVTTSDTVILADATSGAIVITLPTASTISGYRFFIKKIDSSANTVTLTRSGSDTIDGGTTAVISVRYTSITIVSDGSNWYII